MTHQKIFWLDDNPNFLERVLRVARQHGTTQESLFPRITFAFDRTMADEILATQSFDLYILDGDFPDRLPDHHRQALDAIVQKSTPFSESRYYDHMEQAGVADVYSEATVVWCNFVRVYYQHLAAQAPVVVLSSAGTPARLRAFHAGLPFYGKNGLDVKRFQEEVRRATEHEETADASEFNNPENQRLSWQFLMAKLREQGKAYIRHQIKDGQPICILTRALTSLDSYECGELPAFVTKYLV
jgi:hypothetical protein